MTGQQAASFHPGTTQLKLYNSDWKGACARRIVNISLSILFSKRQDQQTLSPYSGSLDLGCPTVEEGMVAVVSASD